MTRIKVFVSSHCHIYTQGHILNQNVVAKRRKVQKENPNKKVGLSQKDKIKKIIVTKNTALETNGESFC